MSSPDLFISPFVIAAPGGFELLKAEQAGHGSVSPPAADPPHAAALRWHVAAATWCGADAAGRGAPEAELDTAGQRLRLWGDSRLEHAARFYGPLIARLRAHLDRCRQQHFDVEIALEAIDGGSRKMVFALFDTLNEAALAGNSIAVHWRRLVGNRQCADFREALRERFARLEFIDGTAAANHPFPSHGAAPLGAMP